MKLDLLIFDFDGTLVDTAYDICEAVNILFEKKGLDKLTHEQIRPEIGMGLRTLLERTIPSGEGVTAESVTKELHDIYDRIHLDHATIFEGAEDLLRSWKGQIAIISNKPERYVHSLLRHLNLQELPWVDVLGGDSLPTKKPDVEPFEQVLRKAGASPEASLMFGDGEPDIRGALNSGIRPVAVEFGYGPVDKLRDLGAWKTVKDFKEISELAESLA